jgi:hypothetical protein
MVPHNFDIDRSALPVHERGALLMALLAYPLDSDEESRAGLYGALCSVTLRGWLELLDDAQSSQPFPIRPAHALRGLKQNNRSLRTFKRRLRDRMHSGKMANAWLLPKIGIRVVLPDHIQQLSVDALSVWAAEELGHSEPGNVETRIWRPSRSVIHLAAAIDAYATIWERLDEGGAFHLGHLLTSDAALDEIVQFAERLATVIEQSPEIPIDATRLLRVRFVN